MKSCCSLYVFYYHTEKGKINICNFDFKYAICTFSFSVSVELVEGGLSTI